MSKRPKSGFSANRVSASYGTTCLAWIRTMTKRSRVACATVTPRGKREGKLGYHIVGKSQMVGRKSRRAAGGFFPDLAAPDLSWTSPRALLMTDDRLDGHHTGCVLSRIGIRYLSSVILFRQLPDHSRVSAQLPNGFVTFVPTGGENS